jgi:hypothetical protein
MKSATARVVADFVFCHTGPEGPFSPNRVSIRSRPA